MGCSRHTSLNVARHPATLLLEGTFYTYTLKREGEKSSAALKLGFKRDITLSHQQKAREKQTSMPWGPLVSHTWVTGLVRTLRVIRGDMPTLAPASLSKRGDLWSSLAGFGILHSVVRNRRLQAQFCFPTGLLFLFCSRAVFWAAGYASTSVIQRVMSVLFLLLLFKNAQGL